MEKETSCINARAILDYVRVHQGGDAVQHLVQDLHPEIDDLLDPESFLRDPNNWISCAVIAKLYGRAKILLNDDMAAFHIARYAIEHSSMGYTQRLIFKGLWSVDKILQNLQQINDQWNRNKIVDVVETYRKGAVVRLFLACPHEIEQGPLSEQPGRIHLFADHMGRQADPGHRTMLLL
ncbi:hypothetical protein D3OALGB2SA_1095 [Olavius algarvensis associated proteobacterium Delta 3]|nr:hypothetical protein D3OALGB2SA_1095 [Olavius algarvensis associated proteobacterium Delta 3]